MTPTRSAQQDEARRLGTRHGRRGEWPYGDMSEVNPSEAFLTTVGALAEPRDWQDRLGYNYVSAWCYAAGRDYMAFPAEPGVLTPRGFVLALAANDVDATLEILGGPGAWPLITGWLPDGRTWILGDADDAGFVGPDAPIPARLHLQVYESAAENAARWAFDPRNRDGLDFNDPIGILSGLSPARAADAIRRAWSGDYSPFAAAGDIFPPLPPVENTTGEGGVPMFDAATRAYLRAVRLTPGWVTAPWHTSDCPQCGHAVHGGGLVTCSDGEISQGHVVVRGSVVLGCEGGWIISPAAVGISRPQWIDWRGELECAWINHDAGGDGDRYVVTLFGAYVGPIGAEVPRTYSAALALLRAEVDSLNTAALGVPPGWQPDVYYHETATGLMIRFPCRLDQVREDWDRPARLEDELWYAGLGPHIGVEAMCLLCGETFNPGGPDDMTHGQTSEEEPCGGPGVILGAWGAPVAPGRASAIEAVRAVGIPYAWTDPETGARTCPACQAVIAEDHNPDGEPLTRHYADHYQREHGNR